jgi:hypothetical protein
MDFIAASKFAIAARTSPTESPGSSSAGLGQALHQRNECHGRV